MVTIYALKDNGVVFYIGQTTCIGDRMNVHNSSHQYKRTLKERIINDIITNGRELTYEILDICNSDDGLIIERYFINKYLDEGYNLVNKKPLKHHKPAIRAIDYDGFSGKERQLLQLIANDNKAQDIAKITKQSVRTIETRIYKIKKKAEVKTIAGLMYFAYHNNLVT